MADTHPATRARFTAAVTHEGEWYVARCLEVEVTSQGPTFESALVNLREALELFFEDASLADVPPAPIIAPVEAEITAI
jgi:predicted RNase H-like HicB family nuclease